jgi:Uma2 family endonuclease
MSAVIATLRPLTYDDLRQMPDDGKRHEVIGGELVVNPAPRRDHRVISANLDWILQQFLRAIGAGRMFTVVEILSPNTRRNDLIRKMALYAGSGVPEYWLADPDQKTFVLLLLEGDEYVPAESETDGTLTSRVFPNLRVDPAEVFAGLD